MTALKTILYFSIFDFPITAKEVFTYSKCKSQEEVHIELQELLDKEIIFKIDNFYLNTNRPELITKRILGKKMATDIMPKALKMAKKIALFPFIRGVSFSGAFSKGYFDEEGDIDFFIITSKNRLWIARTLLILYKKIFLLNSRKYFCVNYFISEQDLIIAEKNKFTATEIATLLPIYGKHHFESFYNCNNWVRSYYPNVSPEKNLENTKKSQQNSLKKFIEKLINKTLGWSLEQFFFRLTFKKWKKKFRHLAKNEFEIAFKSTEKVSKHHPNNYQKKVIDLLNAKYVEVTEAHQIILEPEHA